MAVSQMQGLDTLYKPWGMTAGGMVGRRETDMEAADLLNLEEGQLGNIIKAVEASRAANDFNDPRMEMLRQQGIMGKDMSNSAAGQLAMGTLDSSIGAGNAKNRASQSGNEIDSMIDAMDRSVAMIESNGPSGLAMAMQGMPPQLQQLAQQTGPQFPVVLKRLSDMLKQQRMQTPKHLGDMELEGFKQEGTYITEDMKQEAADKRNRDDNAARYADIAARRAEAAGRTKEAGGMRKEAEISRRIQVTLSELKANEVELNRISEDLLNVDSNPLPGVTKGEKQKIRTKMKEGLNKEKNSLLAEQTRLRNEAKRLATLSTFSELNSSVVSASPKPAAPALPPGVTVVPSKK